MRLRGRERRPTLAARTAVVTTAAAAIAVVLAGLVSLSLIRGAADHQARVNLARLTDVVAGRASVAVRRRAPLGGAGAGAAGALLRGTRITALRVLPDGRVVGPRAALLGSAIGPAVADGRRLDVVADLGGRRFFVSGRSFSGGGGGVLLIQPASDSNAITAPLVRRLGLALLIGLAGAATAGVLLSRRLARPLASAARAAQRMAAGDRDVRLVPDGPAEVAEVSESLNALAAALEVSESRQREFLLSISHELRTPLTGITGFAEALADGVTTDPAGAGTVLLAEARRLERLVSDLLDLARLGAVDFRIESVPVDLGSVLDAAARVWQPRCEAAGVELRLEIDRPAPVVRTDPVRVRQILDGLAENALKAAPPGTPVVFCAACRDGQAVLEVRDGGPGLTAQDREVAFERSALHDRYRGIRRVGTGVGLALVAGLAARLGGRAEVGEAAEGGARFAVRLPPGPDGGANPPR